MEDVIKIYFKETGFFHAPLSIIVITGDLK
jgi:hypothetical protein